MAQVASERPPEPPPLARPEQFYGALSAVVGQDELRTKLASVFYQYLLYLRDPQAGRPNMLVYGRSGSGKTYAVQQCVAAANLAWTMPSAAGLAPPGFRGRVFHDVLIDHWLRWKTDYGVIFLDEVDKWCSGSMQQHQQGRANRASSEIEMGGIAMQQELLRYLEGEVVTFTDDAKDVEQLEGVAFDTSHALWVLGGAFVGLDRHIRARLHNHHLQEDDVWENAIPADFKRYGMTAELADRVSTWAWTTPLRVPQMIQILKEQDVPRWHRRFGALGLALELEDGAIGACATHAWEMREGPRIARAMLNRGMDDILAHASRQGMEDAAWDGVVRVNAQNVRSGAID